jgi:hypothetical protein
MLRERRISGVGVDARAILHSLSIADRSGSSQSSGCEPKM